MDIHTFFFRVHVSLGGPVEPDSSSVLESRFLIAGTFAIIFVCLCIRRKWRIGKASYLSALLMLCLLVSMMIQSLTSGQSDYGFKRAFTVNFSNEVLKDPTFWMDTLGQVTRYWKWSIIVCNIFGYPFLDLRFDSGKYWVNLFSQ